MMRLQEIQGPTHEIPPVDTSEKKFSGRSRLYIGNINPTTSEEKLKVDLSEKALGYARRNAEANGCNVEFFSMDFLDASNWYGLPVCDLILSNPPYVPQKESEEMAPHVLQHEPHLALFVPDDDPLLFYRSLLEFARSGVQKGGISLWKCIRPVQKMSAKCSQMKAFPPILSWIFPGRRDSFLLKRINDNRRGQGSDRAA